MWLPSAILFSLSIATCRGYTLPFPSSLGRIINGETVEPGEIPYQVSLQRPMDRFHFCGGSVISETYVITAAHCVLGRLAKSVIVVAGTNDITEGQGIIRNVRRINTHEGYDPRDAYRNDIALLKEGGQSPKLLQRATIEISDQEYCTAIYHETFNMEVDDSQVCADVPGGGKGSCHGDSGGPLTVNGELTGLVSWANGCAREGYPTVYTRVSQFLDWIEKTAV
ncbi:trypsin zeta-like isoform X2 [Neodiprion virginianus]|uniref:trypsin zeta-like isoform X2 n=1 Tax=Neodiprion fabricii TaxID=2872261 RepID=UPI001ED943C7|nr:trypsin zeta-like isoform X2 [Neodiprion fabricii]XP_046603435.1 trypsin zeta-like isoform X2 [Neodiprion virginianus]